MFMIFFAQKNFTLKLVRGRIRTACVLQQKCKYSLSSALVHCEMKAKVRAEFDDRRSWKLETIERNVDVFRRILVLSFSLDRARLLTMENQEDG